MNTPGMVMLGEDVIGQFIVGTDDKVVFMFNRDDANLSDILDFASENGVTISLIAAPIFDSATDGEVTPNPNSIEHDRPLPQYGGFNCERSPNEGNRY